MSPIVAAILLAFMAILTSTPTPIYGENMADCMFSYQVLPAIKVVCPSEASIFAI